MRKGIVRLWQKLKGRPLVRPWALAAPILILLVAIPLIRLRKPAELSESEKSRLATVQAIVERNTLEISRSLPALAATKDRVAVGRAAECGRQSAAEYSKQPPVMSVLLAGPYWIMHEVAGMNLPEDADTIVYLLIAIGVTLPVAGAAGMVYRLGRLFGLSRPIRAGLGLVVVCGSGLLSYSTVLSSNALAASLVLAACACLFHGATMARPSRQGVWMAVSGLLAGLAATVDLGAAVFTLLLCGVVLAVPWSRSRRIAGLVLYVMGTLPPLALHAALTISMTGDLLPGFLHPELLGRSLVVDAPADAADGETAAGVSRLGLLVDSTLGSRGLLSHFPIVILGIAGIGLVVRRHWPAATKMLAGATALAACGIVLAYVAGATDWSQPMFCVRWFVVFAPLLLLWVGAWMRREHRPVTWAMAAALLVFSTLTGIVGATNPLVAHTPGQYTAYTVARQLLQASATPPTTPQRLIRGGL